MKKTFDNVAISERALDAAWIRNKAIAQNLANVDTPGYKRKTVQFEELLKRVSNETISSHGVHEKRIKIGNKNDMKIKVSIDNKNLSYRLDGNNVDIDNEMASMAKNTIKYNVLVQSLNAGFRRLKSVISEGRR